MSWPRLCQQQGESSSGMQNNMVRKWQIACNALFPALMLYGKCLQFSQRERKRRVDFLEYINDQTRPLSNISGSEKKQVRFSWFSEEQISRKLRPQWVLTLIRGTDALHVYLENIHGLSRQQTTLSMWSDLVFIVPWSEMVPNRLC